MHIWKLLKHGVIYNGINTLILINVSEILQLSENTGLLMATCLCYQNGRMECWNIGDKGVTKPF